MTTKYERQETIIDINRYKRNRITIIGCGAVGSFVGVTLSKMGFEDFVLYDNDIIEEHNIPNQFFTELQRGRNKVSETRRMMRENNKNCNVIEDYSFNNNKLLDGQVVICCVDNMTSRYTIFNKAKECKDIQLFIDTRMGGLQGQVYAIDMTDPKDVAYYESTLFPDSEADLNRCSQQSIIYAVLGIASVVCRIVTRALTGKEFKNFTMIDYGIMLID